MKLALFALAALFTLSSCSTYRKAVAAIDDNEHLVGPAVALVTSVVFDKAVSEEDKVEKAKLVSSIADKILEFPFDKKPTQEEIASLIAGNLPEKAHWVSLASAVSELYGKYTEKLLDSDVEKSVAVLKSIAANMKLSTQRYLD